MVISLNLLNSSSISPRSILPLKPILTGLLHFFWCISSTNFENPSCSCRIKVNIFIRCFTGAFSLIAFVISNKDISLISFTSFWYTKSCSLVVYIFIYSKIWANFLKLQAHETFSLLQYTESQNSSFLFQGP